MRLNRERSNRRNLEEWSRSRKWEASITVTNDERLEKESTSFRRFSVSFLRHRPLTLDKTSTRNPIIACFRTSTARHNKSSTCRLPNRKHQIPAADLPCHAVEFLVSTSHLGAGDACTGRIGNSSRNRARGCLRDTWNRNHPTHHYRSEE